MNAYSSLPSAYFNGDKIMAVPADALLQSALGTPMAARVALQDERGNLRIPFLEYLPSYTSDITEQWVPVTVSNTSVIYSSLIGIPIAGLPSVGNTTFNLTTSYWLLNCPELKGSVLPPPMPVVPDHNSSISNSPTWGAMGSDVVNRCNTTESAIPPREIYYYSYDPNTNVTSANCTMTTSYVEVAVFCEGDECQATNMRRSLDTTPSSAITSLDDCNWEREGDDIWGYYGDRFVNALSSGGSSGSPSAMQTFFFDPADPFNLTELSTDKPLYTVGNVSFAKTLAQLMNSYYIATVGSDAIFLGHVENFNTIQQNPETSNPNLTFTGTSGTLTLEQECLVYNMGWMVALIISTAVMMAAAFVKLIVDMFIVTPKLLMNVTTLTRNNPYFDLPLGGDTLGDAERGRLLGEITARFGDRLPEEKFGILAIGSTLEEGGEIAKMAKGRRYL